MALEALVARYGLGAIFLGAGLEGEAVVLTGGLLAHKGLLPVWGVALAAALGACIIDQLWFWMGRHFSHIRWVEKVKRKPAFKRALGVLERHLILFTLGFRFIYGMRTVAPIAISASKIRSRTFVVLNVVSAAIWGPVLTWLGYGIGQALDPWLKSLQSVLMVAAAVIVVGVGIAALVRMIGRRRQSSGRKARVR